MRAIQAPHVRPWRLRLTIRTGNAPAIDSIARYSPAFERSVRPMSRRSDAQDRPLRRGKRSFQLSCDKIRAKTWGALSKRTDKLDMRQANITLIIPNRPRALGFCVAAVVLGGATSPPDGEAFRSESVALRRAWRSMEPTFCAPKAPCISGCALCQRARRRGVKGTGRMFRPNTVAGDLSDFPPTHEARGLRANDVLATEARPSKSKPGIPGYLQKYYWWAYVHRNAIRVFERQWLVDAILFGNYARLKESALTALGESLPGRTLQIACAYGDMTNGLCDRVQAGSGTLDVVDVLPTQLENLRRKMPEGAPVQALLMDSAALNVPDASYDRALLFFLLHEQPVAWRRRTLAEALRVVKPGGRIVIVDYAGPYWWNPIRYLLGPALRVLEPFAHDLWREDIGVWMPRNWAPRQLERKAFFGGLYQRICFNR